MKSLQYLVQACQGEKEEKGRVRLTYQSSTHTSYLEELDPIQFAERNWNCKESFRWTGEELKSSCPPFY